MPNIGKAVGDFLGFDPTPGFNLGGSSSGAPVITGTGVNPRTGQRDQNAGVFWKGSDGNVYVSGKDGTNSAGNFDGNTANYWNAQGFKQISDPNVGKQNVAQPGANNTSTYNTGTGSGSGASWSSSDQANYQAALDQANFGLDRLPNQLKIAQGNINNGYNNALHQQDVLKGNAQTTYNNGNTENQQNYRTSQNDINQMAAGDRQSLLRYLASMGAGGGSEALYAVPEAVGEVASKGLSGASQNFAGNSKALTTNWQNFQNDDKQKRIDLANEQANQLNQAQAQNDSSRSSLLEQIRSLNGQRAAAMGGNVAASMSPFTSKINSLATKIDNLGKLQANYSGPTAAYAAPSLESFAPAQSGLAEAQVQQNAQSGVTPYLQLLLGNKDKRDNGTVTAVYDPNNQQNGVLI